MEREGTERSRREEKGTERSRREEMRRGLELAIFILAALALGPALASGHALVIDYGVESVYIEAYYGGVRQTPVQYADVEVFYPDGRLYVEGKTDENGKFRFDPKFGKEWLVVVESVGHRNEKMLNLTAAGVGAGEAGRGEIPLYLKIFAGLGYILGIQGLFLWYKGFKQARQSKKKN